MTKRVVNAWRTSDTLKKFILRQLCLITCSVLQLKWKKIDFLRFLFRKKLLLWLASNKWEIGVGQSIPYQDIKYSKVDWLEIIITTKPTMLFQTDFADCAENLAAMFQSAHNKS